MQERDDSGTFPTPLHDVVAQASHAPERLAIMSEVRSLTFGELVDAVTDCRAALAARGISDGNVIAVHLPNRWEYVVVALAVDALGGALMPLSPTLGSYEISAALADGAAHLFVGESPVIEKGDVHAQQAHDTQYCDITEIVSVPRARETKPLYITDVSPNAIVQIDLTSGSTGLPKLARRTARARDASYRAFTRRLALGANDIALPMSPVTQGVGGMGLHCLRLGGSIVMSGEARLSPKKAIDMITRFDATVVVGVPTNIIGILECLEIATTHFESLRAAAIAGSMMPADVARRWEQATGSRICIFYGSMDAGHLSMVSPDDPDEKRWYSTGRVQDECEAKILGADGLELPLGDVGEIWMSGATMAEPATDTAAVGVTVDASGLRPMGDLGYFDQDGFLYVAGRAKDIIIRGGNNINPYEVETLLRGNQSIADVCVVGGADDRLGERPVAFVVLRNAADLTLDDVRSYLGARGLAKYKWPEALLVLPELPLVGPGKVNRVLLRGLATEEISQM